MVERASPRGPGQTWRTAGPGTIVALLFLQSNVGAGEQVAGITFEHVSKWFGEVPVLRNLNLHVEDQEFLVLVGPSGCGKTTALRCLAGLEQVSEGNIYIGDRLVNHLPPKDRDIAMVFQSYALYPHMTVYDNLAFSLRLRQKNGFLRTPFRIFSRLFRQQHNNKSEVSSFFDQDRQINRRITEAATMLGIDQLLNRKPHSLSGGQQQRVALGRAIVRNPSVFLMDEPLSNLDARLRVQMRTEISKLHQRIKTTVIYVTHDQTEAMTMGNRIAVMNDGDLQQLDTPQRLYDHPANQFVASFIGSPAMNFFDADLVASDAHEGLVVRGASGLSLPVPPRLAQSLTPHLGKPVIVGIRPENLHDPDYLPAGADGSVRVRARVSVTEHMGSEIYVYLEHGREEFVARFDPRSAAQVGEWVEAVFAVENLHLFDRQTKQALL